MKYFWFTLIFLAITMAGMALGVIFSNKSLKGSCGGLGKVMGEDCDYCDKKDQCVDEEKCVETGEPITQCESKKPFSC